MTTRLSTFLRSGGLASAAAVLGIVTMLSTTGCGPGHATHVDVDTGAVVSPASVVGDGFFIDYASGGHWRVITTCVGSPCHWNMKITPPPGDRFTAITPFGMGPNDTLTMMVDGSIEIDTLPAVGDLSGITFDGTPGAWIEEEAASLATSGAPVWVVSGGESFTVPQLTADLYPSAP